MEVAAPIDNGVKDRIALAPLAPSERIQALDVLRGFALIGILLMNIEFFNRTTHGIAEGMPAGLTSVDWFVSWFIAYFVQGKFWTIFSLLFGMGFAVMLARVEAAGRDFLGTYLRRIGALAVFGAAHYIFLWDGDILFSYAVGAGALLVLLFARWKHTFMALALVVGAALVTGVKPIWAVAGVLLALRALSLYLRGERRVPIGGVSRPLFSVVLSALGCIAALAATALWLLPDGPKEPRVPVTLTAVGLLIAGALAAQFHDPVELRPLRLGVGIYVFVTLMMTSMGAVQYLTPLPSATPGASADKAVQEKAQKAKAEQVRRLAAHEEERRVETHILSKGTYAEAVLARGGKFPAKVAQDAAFSVLLIAMFLIGVWFVRSGVMADTQAHLGLFRRLFRIGLPSGIALGLAGSLIAVSSTPGDPRDGFLAARGLAMLGNLPACLGYVGMVVLMLHSRSLSAQVGVLAPFGRMALTNYLMQSVICSTVFYGYGFSQWGMARSWQVVFVVLLLAAQIGLSHWWLARFRFGPMEWVWRGFTYRQTPPTRLHADRAIS